MSRTNFGDFDVITGPPAPMRRVPAASLPRPAEPSAPDESERKPAAPEPNRPASP